MHRGTLQLTKDELDALVKAFHWDINGGSTIASKLQYATDSADDIKSISVSEEDLELILDDIMPVDSNNALLTAVSEKIGEQLREIRKLETPTRTEYV